MMYYWRDSNHHSIHHYLQELNRILLVRNDIGLVKRLIRVLRAKNRQSGTTEPLDRLNSEKSLRS